MTKIEKQIEIIGVPLDLGANIRGANMAPSAIRIADIKRKLSEIGCKVKDSGDLVIPVREELPENVRKQKFLPTIVDVCSLLRDRIEQSLESGNLPLVLGGDHSIAVGSISGVQRHFQKSNQNIGLLWIDAHADLNTPESSPSGNIHGMPLAILLNKGHPELTQIGGKVPKIKPEHIALVGIRTIDDQEKEILKKSGIRYFTMREIDERTMFNVMNEALAIVTKGTVGVHLSFDIDGVDPLYAPGVSTPVTGGLSYREAHLALEMLADTKKLCSMEFVELNPMTDVSHKTAVLTVELVQSALGKAIV